MKTNNFSYSSGTKKKIFNDPVYGFISFPHEILYDLIDHPYMQRLRRIKQLGLTDFVYPGATHSRFHHCLGALHLMTEAISSLKWKGIEITNEESEAVCVAILLHDIGHGPFSHALEKIILPLGHEEISLRVMQLLNDEFDGKLGMAIRIFKDEYPKKFLHELVASQLDVDRMDYLNRDSFYTGVVEGMIGYDRVIKMLNVVDGRLVVEEKGALSVEQFLMARRLMYWQVYLHKTVLAVEKMLLSLFSYQYRFQNDLRIKRIPENLEYFIKRFSRFENQSEIDDEAIRRFMELDDTEVIIFLKTIINQGINASQLLAKGIIDRKIFKINIKNSPFSNEFEKDLRLRIENQLKIDPKEIDYLLISGQESNATYTQNVSEIQILFKNGEVVPFTETSDYFINTNKTVKYFIIFPILSTFT